ncbi:FecR family protein [Paenibacillus sedimenti]|uniref:FecR domain-containing protein n=1 Tax=Paenibacillus sedimenti TaxID=2770274 RepID=A0A926KRS6_9BACL|nr:FecR family protein [Paenibacillus sedimenti]MBD0381098.1 FecR domain-containing protein [Paenibacillus sedimenti]
MQFTKKSFFSLFVSFCMLFGFLSAILVNPAEAKTVRVAVITSLSGEVTVKKGGGSKTYDAYENMSLNQGDTLYTGTDSSVTLNLSNGDADVTLGDNAELNVSDLNTSDGNKKSKLKIWAGSMWVKVKSLAGSNDEFEVETPTAVMGVRGTQFFVGVDPRSGKAKMAVGAGKVSATTVIKDGNNFQTKNITYLYPTQQISLGSRDEVTDPSLKVEFINLKDIVKDASPSIIQAIIDNKAQIDKENDEFIAKKKKELEEGKAAKDETSLYLKNLADLDKVKRNFDNLVGNIAKQAVADNKISKSVMEKIIEGANKKIPDPNRYLDLDKVQELDKTAGVDPELEKKKQEELKKLEAAMLKKQEEEDKKLAEIKAKLDAVLKAAEEVKKKIEEANKKAAEEAVAKAKEVLNSQNGSTTPAPTAGGNDDNDPTPSPTPKVSLSAGTHNPLTNTFDLKINMSDFNGLNDIYAVEVHLLYGDNSESESHPYIYYHNESDNLESGIFDSTKSAYHIQEYYGESQHELVYAITNYGSDAGNVEVSGTKTLVTIPFHAYSMENTIASIKVGSITIVRKDSNNNVQTLNIPVTSIDPAIVSIIGTEPR